MNKYSLYLTIHIHATYILILGRYFDKKKKKSPNKESAEKVDFTYKKKETLIFIYMKKKKEEKKVRTKIMDRIGIR